MHFLRLSFSQNLFPLRSKVHLKLFSSTPSPHHLWRDNFLLHHSTHTHVAFATNKLASSPGSESQTRISVVRDIQDIYLRSALHSEQKH
ncbi:hypothetical protein FVER53590_29929 [Fusarium verticillioides]|nr:hypothetical protein FVER53590_29929 [Fusarium verticillioides]